MPWLVVLGNGSWGVQLAKEWIEDPVNGRVWPDSPLDANGEPLRGRWNYPSKTYRAERSPFEVDAFVAAKVAESGYDWLLLFEHEPEVTHDPPSGMLTLEDVQVGRSAGARVVEHTVEDVPVVAPEPEPQFEHECKHPGCTRSFPSSAALERHVEFEHTARHDQDEKRRIAEYARLQEEREALARMEQMPDALPVWEREAVARGVEPGPE